MAARLASHTLWGLISTEEFSLVSALPGEIFVHESLGSERKEWQRQQGQQEDREDVPTCRARTQLRVSQILGCSEMAKAKPA